MSKNIENKYIKISLIHLLFGGIILPIVSYLFITWVLKITFILLAIIYAGTYLYVFSILILQLLSIYLGVSISANLIKKRYENIEHKKIINFSSILFTGVVFTPLILLRPSFLLIYISAGLLALFFHFSTKRKLKEK